MGQIFDIFLLESVLNGLLLGGLVIGTLVVDARAFLAVVVAAITARRSSRRCCRERGVVDRRRVAHSPPAHDAVRRGRVVVGPEIRVVIEVREPIHSGREVAILAPAIGPALRVAAIAAAHETKQKEQKGSKADPFTSGMELIAKLIKF